MRRRLLPLLFGLGLGLGDRAAQAQPRDPGWLSQYQAPVGCPGEAAFLAAVAQRLQDREPVGEPGALRVKVTRRGRTFAGQLQRRKGGRTFERRLRAKGCPALVDALSLVTAMVLLGRPPTMEELPAGAEEGATRPASDADTATPPPEVAQAPPASAARPPSAQHPNDPGAPLVRLGVLGGVILGNAPQLAPLFGVSVAVAPPKAPLWLRLDASLSPSGEVQNPLGTGRWWLATLDLSACYAGLGAGALAALPCLTASGGFFNARGRGEAGGERAVIPYAALGPLAVVRYQPKGASFYAELLAAVALALRRERFLIEPGATLHRIPLLSPRAGLGLGWELR